MQFTVPAANTISFLFSLLKMFKTARGYVKNYGTFNQERIGEYERANYTNYSYLDNLLTQFKQNFKIKEKEQQPLLILLPSPSNLLSVSKRNKKGWKFDKNRDIIYDKKEQKKQNLKDITKKTFCKINITIHCTGNCIVRGLEGYSKSLNLNQ